VGKARLLTYRYFEIRYANNRLNYQTWRVIRLTVVWEDEHVNISLLYWHFSWLQGIRIRHVKGNQRHSILELYTDVYYVSPRNGHHEQLVQSSYQRTDFIDWHSSHTEVHFWAVDDTLRLYRCANVRPIYDVDVDRSLFSDPTEMPFRAKLLKG
jgi:hypothetical protein